MDIRNLQVLATAAHERSFTAAARRLHTSQSALSQLVRRIEDELGFAVFDRSVSPIALTDAGRRFMPHAREICALYGAALASSRDAQLLRPISIGASPRMASLVFPAILETEESGTIQLVEGDSRELGGLITRGVLDAAIMSDAAVTEDLAFAPVLASEFCAAHSSTRAPADEGGFRARDLASHDLLLPSAGGVRRHLAPFLDQLDDVQIALESASSETLLGLAALDLGTAIVPELFIEDFDRARHPGLRFTSIVDGPAPLVSGVAIRRTESCPDRVNRAQTIARQALLGHFRDSPYATVPFDDDPLGRTNEGDAPSP